METALKLAMNMGFIVWQGGGQSIVTAYIDTACQDAGICSVLERYGVQLL